MIIVEAYAAHKPVIVGNIGNIACLVDEGITGLHFDYNSSETLRNVVRRLESMNTESMEDNAYVKYEAELFRPKEDL